MARGTHVETVAAVLHTGVQAAANHAGAAGEGGEATRQASLSRATRHVSRFDENKGIAAHFINQKLIIKMFTPIFIVPRQGSGC